MRDSILMYRSQIEALRNLPPEQFKASLLAIADYAMNGIEPDSDPVAMAMWMMAKPIIDKNNKRYENGTKGGRTKSKSAPNDEKTETKEEPNRNQTETKPEPNTKLKDKGKRIKEKEENINTLSGAPVYQYQAVIDYLNEKAGTAYKYTSRDTRSHIKARFDEKATLEDFYKVIDTKVAEWKGTDMEKFLRPSTLFGSKFESYLNQKPRSVQQGNRFVNFQQREYDYEDLERKLLAAQRG